MLLTINFFLHNDFYSSTEKSKYKTHMFLSSAHIMKYVRSEILTKGKE